MTPRKEEKKQSAVPELQERVVYINRVSKVVKGGRRFGLTALVVVGDGEGHVGVGMGKSQEVPIAIKKGIEDAKKNMFEVPMNEDRTLPHDIMGEFGAGRVYLKPAAPGTGIIAGGPVRALLELAGFKNVFGKSLGSSNAMNIVKAAAEGLKELSAPTEVAERRNMTVGQINGQVMSHEISKEDYLKFINYEDKCRLQLFDKVFDEVKIKNASNGELQDNVKSGNLTTANGVVALNGDYSLVSEKSSAVITSATAWKDEISGNYLMNVRTNKDVGMWSFKITEAQYNNFKYSTDEERAKLLTNMIPLTDENKEKMKVVASNTLYQGGYTRGQNANIPPSLAKVLKDLKAAGLGYEIITSSNTSEQERFDAIKKGLQKLQDYGQAKGKDVKMPSDSEIWQMLKENPDPRKLPSVETRTKETVLYGKEVINLNDLREQTKINLLGDASINGESLNNIKASKEWKRSGEHGRATEVGDIAVERIKDANGNAVEGKYKMTAVIDGNVFSHEITQKQYDKFLAINDYQRMKLFDKIFPEVEMKTKPESRFNLGAAILAAVTVGADVVAGLSAPPRPRPEIYESAPVFHKPGVVSPQAVSAAVYESLAEQPGRGQNEGMGMGR